LNKFAVDSRTSSPLQSGLKKNARTFWQLE
jgi:hypothetical protein